MAEKRPEVASAHLSVTTRPTDGPVIANSAARWRDTWIGEAVSNSGPAA